MPPTTRKVDLNIEIDVLTAGSTAEVVNTILEFLLYQRNQIPFVYKTFKYYVGKWLDDNEAENTIVSMRSFQMRHQREQAEKTKVAITAMQELISKSFEDNDIKCLRFLFGATTFTPTEVYTIHIPTEAIEQSHHHQNHRLSHGHLSQALLTLLTCKDLYTIFSKNLYPTNLHLELEILKDDNRVAGAVTHEPKVFLKEICQLPASCKDVHLYLLHTPPLQCDNKALQCCEELQIFEDMLELNLNSEQQLPMNCRKKSDKKPISSANCSFAWWEADIIVRGFKEKSVAGANIWSE